MVFDKFEEEEQDKKLGVQQSIINNTTLKSIIMVRLKYLILFFKFLNFKSDLIKQWFSCAKVHMHELYVGVHKEVVL